MTESVEGDVWKDRAETPGRVNSGYVLHIPSWEIKRLMEIPDFQNNTLSNF